VYYLMGERFDEDPFLLLELRGRSRDEVAAALRERRVVGEPTEDQVRYLPDALGAVETERLEECLDCYWKLGPEAADVALSLSAPEVDMALLKRLGVPGFLDARSFWAQMERVYGGVMVRALDIAFADAESQMEE
jgi:uncharacterized Zn finger protein